MSKCHIVGNHMSRLNYHVVNSTVKQVVQNHVLFSGSGNLQKPVHGVKSSASCCYSVPEGSKAAKWSTDRSNCISIYEWIHKFTVCLRCRNKWYLYMPNVILCVFEQRRLWQDYANAQTCHSLRWSPKRDKFQNPQYCLMVLSYNNLPLPALWLEVVRSKVTGG